MDLVIAGCEVNISKELSPFQVIKEVGDERVSVFFFKMAALSAR